MKHKEKQNSRIKRVSVNWRSASNSLTYVSLESLKRDGVFQKEGGRLVFEGKKAEMVKWDFKKARPNYMLLTRMADGNKLKGKRWRKICYADNKWEKSGLASLTPTLYSDSSPGFHADCCPVLKYWSSFMLQVPPRLRDLPKKLIPQAWVSSPILLPCLPTFIPVLSQALLWLLLP